MASVMSEGHWNLFAMPSGAPVIQLHQLTSGAPLYRFGWTRDGRLIRLAASGLSLLDPATGNSTSLALPDNTIADTIAACPDGRFFVFDIFSKGSRALNIWRMDAAGGNLKQLTSGNLDQYPVCSSNGWVIYQESASSNRLMKVAVDGGSASKVSDELSADFDVSADGKTAVSATFGHLAEHIEKLTLVAVDSGQVLKTMDFERPRSGHIRFSPDGKAIVYSVRTAGVDNLWAQPLDGSKGKQITDFSAEHIIDFHWSFDGKQLGLIRGHPDSDVVLIRDMKQ